MKRIVVVGILLLLFIQTVLSQKETRIVEPFTDNWKFKKIENGFSEKDIQKVEYSDTKWRVLDLPHDWGIEDGFDQSLENNTGLLPWKGIAWYRNTFDVLKKDLDKQIFIEFDGAMANADVYCNGQLVGSWAYGYTSFSLNLTPYLQPKENTIAVRLNTEDWDSRWYPGAGLYRDVRLVKTSATHIAYNGLFIATPYFDKKEGRVTIQTEIQNLSGKLDNINVKADFFEIDENDNITNINQGTDKEKIQLSINQNYTIELEGRIKAPKTWSLKSPKRYLAKVKLYRDDILIDEYKETFGFRTLDFTPRNGFFINGERTFIKGVCNHHDLGPLGSTFNSEAAKRQLLLLRECGVNAIRTAHNPPARELLELCDKLGFIVQVEAFDSWRVAKLPKDYHTKYNARHYEDVKAMIKRDRNHPSVIMWSTGNEVGDQNDPPSSYPLRDIVKSLDPTRPVTIGGSWDNSGTNGFQKGADIYAYTYRLYEYGKFFGNPDNDQQGIFSCESSSTLSSRGEYFFPVDRWNSLANFHVSSYDWYHPGWGNTVDAQFKFHEEYPAVYGEFVWTGFDYIGEPTPYNNDATNLLNFTDPVKKAELKKELDKLGKIEVPARSSYFGIFDLAGFRKDRFYLYQAQWRPDYPMAHILPHWNWEGDREGKKTPVYVYTSGDEAEVFLNGKSLGRKKKANKKYRIIWDDVLYQPGTLKVVAYKNGIQWAEEEIQTTGKAKQIQLSSNVYSINGNNELFFVTVDILDAENRFVATADCPLQFKIKGDAEIIAVDNGDPTSLIPFKSQFSSTFNGKCLVIVKKLKGNSSKKIILNVFGDKLKSSEIILK